MNQGPGRDLSFERPASKAMAEEVNIALIPAVDQALMMLVSSFLVMHKCVLRRMADVGFVSALAVVRYRTWCRRPDGRVSSNSLPLRERQLVEVDTK